MPGTDQWFDLCRCESAEIVAALVKALLMATEGEPYKLIVETQIGG